jgi:hypothetical protein
LWPVSTRRCAAAASAVDDRSELAGLGQLGEDAEVRRLLAGRPEIGVRDDRALVADLCVHSICG